jgi:DNA helicase HerA-like ATPase
MMRLGRWTLNPSHFFSISLGDLMRHACIIGATGTGKTTTLLQIMLDAAHSCPDAAITFIDPTGTTMDTFLKYLPDSRLKDITIIDPMGVEDHGKRKAVAYNVLHIEGRNESIASGTLDILIDSKINEMKELFRDAGIISRMEERYQLWGKQLERTFEIVLRVILRVQPNENGEKTLVDFHRILTDPDVRRSYLDLMTPDDRKYIEYFFSDFYNEKELRGYTNTTLNRIEPLILDPYMRHLFSSPHPSVEISQLTSKGKILLVNASKIVGRETSTTIGTFFSLAIWNATLRKQRDFPLLLVLDEFHNFSSVSFQDIIAEGRQRKIALVVGEQDLSRIHENVRSSLINNCHNWVIFRHVPESMHNIQQILGRGMSSQELEMLKTSLAQMDNHRAFLRHSSEGQTMPTHTIFTSPVSETYNPSPNMIKHLLLLNNAKEMQIHPEHDSMDVLKAIHRHYSTCSSWPTAAQISSLLNAVPQSISLILNQLASEQLIDSKNNSLTDKGLSRLGLNIHTNASTESPEHRHLLGFAKQWFESKGHKFNIVQQGGSDPQARDGFVQMGDAWHAVEAECNLTSPAQVLYNASKYKGAKILFLVHPDGAERLWSILGMPFNQENGRTLPYKFRTGPLIPAEIFGKRVPYENFVILVVPEEKSHEKSLLLHRPGRPPEEFDPAQLFKATPISFSKLNRESLSMGSFVDAVDSGDMQKVDAHVRMALRELVGTNPSVECTISDVWNALASMLADPLAQPYEPQENKKIQATLGQSLSRLKAEKRRTSDGMKYKITLKNANL